MKIREALESDTSAIGHLHAASWRDAYRGLLSDAYLDGPIEAERLAVWHERFAQPAPHQHVLVAECGGELAGFACSYGNHDERWGSLLENLHVAPAHKRQGVGTLLMRAIASRAAEAHPGKGLHLWVLQPNLDAQQFYERLGAEHVGHDVWSPPDGGAIPQLRFAWRQATALLARVEENRESRGPGLAF